MATSTAFAHPFASTVKTFKTASGKSGRFYSLPALTKQFPGVARLPVSLRIVLESVLRHCDGERVLPEHVAELANWQPQAERTQEIPFVVARVVHVRRHRRVLAEEPGAAIGVEAFGPDFLDALDIGTGAGKHLEPRMDGLEIHRQRLGPL